MTTPRDETQPEKAIPPDASLLSGESSPDESGLDNETANALQTPSTGRSVARATAGIVPLHLARFVIGFVAQPLIAHNFGLKWQADAYAVSTDVLQRIWLLFEKVINPAFLPCFIGSLKEDGEKRAWRFASTTLWLTLLALLVVTPLAWWFMPNIIVIVSEKMAGEQHQIDFTADAARVMLWGLVALGLSSLTYTILNGYKRFAIAAMGDTFWKLGIFVGAVVAWKLHMPPHQALMTIVAGYVAGAFLKLLPHIFAIGGKWRYLRPSIDLSDPLVRKMMLLAVPLIAGIVVSELRGMYLLKVADDPRIQVEAGRAALKWSRIIGDNLVQIFPYALSIGIFPYLAELARDKKKQQLTDTMMGALRVCFFVFVPLTAILIALRFPLLRAVWQSGKLTEADTLAMSAPFVAYTLGLVGFSCEMILNQTFYAMTRAWTPSLIGMGMSVIWIAIAKGGVEIGWGLAAIAGAEAFSKSTKCVLMWVMLRRHLGRIEAMDQLKFFVKILFASCAAAALAYGVIWLADFKHLTPVSGAHHFKIKMLLLVSMAGFIGVGTYGLLAYIMGVGEVKAITALGGKLARKLGRS